MTSYGFKSEDIAQGTPGFVAPLSVEFSPDGNLLTYLFPDAKGPRKVFAVNVSIEGNSSSFKLFDTESSGQLSLQEQLRRERMRLFTRGIASYEWSTKGASSLQRLIVPLDGKVIMFDQTSGGHRIIYDGSAGDAVDPHLSPDGLSVAFVINDDLYALHISANEESISVPKRLTFEGAKKGVTCGLADYIAQEEMSRYRGFWWSPDSRSIVYAHADETVVPRYDILHLGKSDPTHSETHWYPFAGKVNPVVKLAVVQVGDLSVAGKEEDTKEHVWLTLFDENDSAFTKVGLLNPEAPHAQDVDYYVARVGWWQDGSVMAQIQNREQTVLQLIRIDAVTGKRTVVVEEKSAVWINLHDSLHLFDLQWTPQGHARAEGDFHFVWASERTGFSQLFLYKYNAQSQTGECLSGSVPIGGGGEFVVESIDEVDTDRNVVYFSGNKGDSRERHLLVASFLPGAEGAFATAQQVSVDSGYHSSAVNLKHGIVADTFSSVTTPVQLRLFKLNRDTNTLTRIGKLTDGEVEDSRFETKPGFRQSIIPPSFHTVRSKDGQVDLHCALYLPPKVAFDAESGKAIPPVGESGDLQLPCIMSVYGGPHVQRVNNHWTLSADLRAQSLAQQGFAVIKCDNRGSYRRGIAFEGALKHDMGNIEVVDQQTVVEYFVGKGLIDAKRVGMFGWSYGGYMSAMSLCRAPDTFHCAVSGAPVTSWDGYDTHYTERYMGTPQLNPKGYEDSSVMTHADKMTGKLMLVHGLIDENVHFRHTARFINSLIQHRKRYELVLFPCERHSPHKLQDRVYMEDIIHEFFTKHLKGPIALPSAKSKM